MIKNKVKELLSELKKFKVQTLLALEYKNGNDDKIFHTSAKLIASDSDIDEAFKWMDKSIMKTMKKYASEYWVVIQTIVNQSFKIFEF